MSNVSLSWEFNIKPDDYYWKAKLPPYPGFRLLVAALDPMSSDCCVLGAGTGVKEFNLSKKIRELSITGTIDYNNSLCNSF